MVDKRRPNREQLTALEKAAAERYDWAKRAPERQIAAEEQRAAQAWARLWPKAKHVTELLVDHAVNYDVSMLSAQHTKAYKKGGIIATMERVVRAHAVGAWDIGSSLQVTSKIQDSHFTYSYALYLDGSANVYGIRGMTEYEWRRGIYIADWVFPYGSTGRHEEICSQIDSALGSFAARHNLSR